MTTLDPLASGDLRIDATAASSPAVVRLAWSGKSNARQADQVILPYLERCLAAAADLGAALELRFEALNHFNSSTIAAIIHVIQQARRRGVRLVVVQGDVAPAMEAGTDAGTDIGTGLGADAGADGGLDSAAEAVGDAGDDAAD